MEGLGRLYNVATSATTAKARVRLQESQGCAIILIGATSGDATIFQYTAASGGTETALAVVTRYYRQASGVWTKVTQAAANTITAAAGGLAVVEIDAAQLSDGYGWVGASHASGSFVILTRDLTVQRAPANLRNISG